MGEKQNERLVDLRESQAASRTSQNYLTAADQSDLSQRGQSGSQTSQNCIQAQAAANKPSSSGNQSGKKK